MASNVVVPAPQSGHVLAPPGTVAMATHERLEVKDNTRTISVSNHPRARLMYYLKCVDDVITLTEPNIKRLMDYANFRKLSQEEANSLFPLVIKYRPEQLIGKVFFHDETIAGRNRFYSIEQTMIAVDENILIGGESKQVEDIMLFKASWLHDNYYEPLSDYKSRSSSYCALQ